MVSDASCDPAGTCEDLGNAIRKIRIDLGIPVEFDIGAVARSSPGPTIALGVIRYDCVDAKAPDGVLIYVKPGVSPDDPADIQSYVRSSPGFPHESTADQWFTESQFESDRQLGSHMIDAVAGDPPDNGATLAWFADQVRRRGD